VAEAVGLFPVRALLPLEEAGRRDESAAPLERLAEQRLLVGGIGTR
jgi:hypothetical protein